MSFSLFLELESNVFEFLHFGALHTGAAVAPFVYFCLQLLSPLLFEIVLLIEARLVLSVIDFVLFKLAKDSLTKYFHLLGFGLHTFSLQLVRVAVLGEFAYLELVILVV